MLEPKPNHGAAGPCTLYPLLAFLFANLQEYGNTLLVRNSSRSAMPDPSTLVKREQLDDPQAPDHVQLRTEAGTLQASSVPA